MVLSFRKTSPQPDPLMSLDEIKTYVKTYDGIAHFVDTNLIVKFVSPGEMELYGDGGDLLEGIPYRQYFFLFRDRYVREGDDIRNVMQRQFDARLEVIPIAQQILTILPKPLRRLLAYMDMERFASKVPQSLCALWPEALRRTPVPDAVYIVRKKRNEYWRFELSGKPIFSSNLELLGWLVITNAKQIEKKEYNQARRKNQLVTPDDKGLEESRTKIQKIDNAMRFCFSQKPLPSHLTLVSDNRGETALAPLLTDTSSLTVEELKKQIEIAMNTGDMSRLCEIDHTIEKLSDEVQKGLRSALGILNPRVKVYFRIHTPPKYRKKSGEISEYTQIQARWRDNGKEKSRTIAAKLLSTLLKKD